MRRAVNRLFAGSDLSLAYAGAVSCLTISLAALPEPVARGLVLDSSTNLVNLRRHPPFVLLVITAVIGHVGATLFVATILSAGMPRRWTAGYTAGLSAVFLVALIVGRSLTDLGHACAWAIGLGLAVLVYRAQRVPLTPAE
jgi:hypothetical protein